MRHTIFCLFAILLVGCAPAVRPSNSPEAIVASNLRYMKEGNGLARWALCSRSLKDNLVESFGSKDIAIKSLSEDAADFAVANSWKTKVINNDSKTATVEAVISGSNKGVEFTRTARFMLVFENGEWLLNE